MTMASGILWEKHGQCFADIWIAGIQHAWCMPGAVRDWTLPPREGGPIRLSCWTVYNLAMEKQLPPERVAT